MDRFGCCNRILEKGQKTMLREEYLSTNSVSTLTNVEQIRDLVFKEIETDFDLEQRQISRIKGQSPPEDKEGKKEFNAYCPTIFTR